MISQACEVTLMLTFLWVFSPLVILHMLKQRTELLFMLCIQRLLAKKSTVTLMSALDKLCIDHLWPIPCMVLEDGRCCWVLLWVNNSTGVNTPYNATLNYRWAFSVLLSVFSWHYTESNAWIQKCININEINVSKGVCSSLKHGRHQVNPVRLPGALPAAFNPGVWYPGWFTAPCGRPSARCSAGSHLLSLPLLDLELANVAGWLL